LLGVTGSAAAFGALLPPLALIAVHRLSHSAATAWIISALTLLAVAHYVEAHGLRVGLGLAVRSDVESTETATSVVVVDEAALRADAPAVVARLAELATSDELVVVYGSDRPARPRRGAELLVAGLAERLPRHDIAVLRLTPRPGALTRVGTVVDELVEEGTVPIVVAPVPEAGGVAARLTDRIRADRVLVLAYTPADGAVLNTVWSRRVPVRNDH
ncbi:hypothetical protein ACFQ0D_18485, partial [Micromonospora zhanjiangensis]